MSRSRAKRGRPPRSPSSPADAAGTNAGHANAASARAAPSVPFATTPELDCGRLRSWMSSASTVSHREDNAPICSVTPMRASYCMRYSCCNSPWSRWIRSKAPWNPRARSFASRSSERKTWVSRSRSVSPTWRMYACSATVATFLLTHTSAFNASERRRRCSIASFRRNCSSRCAASSRQWPSLTWCSSFTMSSANSRSRSRDSCN
mmetsp:Transcript_8407/g.24022  ORF Transcript_8407/g.24022 Transcript_8407/m.24022 type:complete len:206 (-) Transcript_8407:377-994(-)